jgi:predicted NACHT family NTPase
VEFEKRFRQDIEGLLRQLDEEEPKDGGRLRTTRATAAPVTQAYRDWLKSECGGVELLGMRLRHGQAVRLNHIYVPVTVWNVDFITKTEDLERLAAMTPRELRERPQLALRALEHDSLYLSGAPGSGKSTFCRWVAWLVSESAMPTHEVDPPQEYAERFPEELRGHLPVLVRLRDFWRFLPRLPSGSDLSSLEFEQAMVRWLASRQPQGLVAEELRAHLERGTALLILDGVDEIPVSANGDRASWAPRSLLISGLKHGCPDWTKKGNRILLTSRPYGLTTGDTPHGLLPMSIESLPDELQTLLVQRWFRVLADTEEAAQTTARDMQAHLAEHRWLEPLTANPLLLTAMCIIYDEGKRLPQDKHDLYDRIIDTVLHGRYRDPVAKDAARNRLGVIAHGMHTGEGLGEARTTPQAEATYAEIERMLKTYQARSPWTEKGYLGAVETREDLLSNSGLLLSSGEKRARFYHLSFQEFLAAQRILDLTDHSLLDVFRKCAPAPEWRNTLSLLFGRVLGTRVSPEQGINLMRDMIDAISLEAVGLQLVVADCRVQSRAH